MSASVRAARFHGRGDLRVEDIGPLEAPGAGWVRIAVEACGICATDTHEYRAGPVILPSVPHPISGGSIPLTMGHEPVGRVLEIGEGVALKVGTRVAVEGNIVCHACFWCGRGDFQLCSRLVGLGLQTDGGLAEEMLAPAYMCFPCDEVPPTAAALAEPLSVAVRAVGRAEVEPGSTVGIVGAGTIGLLLLQVARHAGAEQVVVIEPVEERRERATLLGADLAVNSIDARAAVAKLTGGIGLDATFECGGRGDAATLAVDLARRGGRAVLMGVSTEELRLSLIDFLLEEKEVRASLSHAYATDFASAVELLVEGAVQTEPIVTDCVPLADVDDAFRMLLEEPAKHLKVLVLPH